MKIPTRSPKSNAGFTILEVLIAVLVLAVGIIGVFGMQVTSTISNQRAYERRVATELAESVLERLKRDSIEWTLTSYPASGTWLVDGAANMAPAPFEGSGAGPDVSAAREAAWTYRTSPGAVPMFNDMGLPSGGTSVAETKNQRFCVSYRLTPLIDGRVLRAEVRITYAKNGDGAVALGGNCRALEQRTITVDRGLLFDEVVVTGLIRQNALQSAAELPTAL
ncbi:MAG: type IV pilus modification protein PilV [Bradymonadia bacterium]